MVKKTLFELNSIYRDNLRITGYKFGNGEPSVCIVGALRGNEVQQVYICSQLIRSLKIIESHGKIEKGKVIMVIPSVNTYSMNISKRFWPTDNTDINRMFPGYNLGETTQRIASGLFEAIKEYKCGIQFASFYIPGKFIPHVRMMKTSFEDVEDAKKFGLPYVMLRTPRPYDTTTLNYNWQVFGTNAFSVYTHETDNIDIPSAMQAVNSVLNFMSLNKIIDHPVVGLNESVVIDDKDIITVKSKTAGIFSATADVNQHVLRGTTLAEILDPYTGETKSRIKSPAEGTVFFRHNAPLTYANAVMFRILPDKIL